MTSLEDFLELEWIEGGADDAQAEDREDEAVDGAAGIDWALRLLLLQHARAARWPWPAGRRWERWELQHVAYEIKRLGRTPRRTGICLALHLRLRCRGSSLMQVAPV